MCTGVNGFREERVTSTWKGFLTSCTGRKAMIGEGLGTN